MAPSDVRAAILVGGASRRFGRDKTQAHVLGTPLLLRVEKALAQVVSEIHVVGKAGCSAPLPGRPFHGDPEPVRSSLAGLVHALRVVPADVLLVVACDHPFLEPAVLRRLIDRIGDAAACIPRPGGRPAPLVAAYAPSRCLTPLAASLGAGRLSLREATGELEAVHLDDEELRELDPDLRSFVNVNEARDLELAELLGESSRGIEGIADSLRDSGPRSPA